MMRLYSISMFMLGVVVVLFLSVKPSFAPPKGGGQKRCGVNMVQAGPICVDQFEASVWSLPPSGKGTPQGQPFGATSDNYPCMDNGNDCSGSNPIFAASVPGVTPSAFITWFQAEQACFNVGKRLLTNAEWQAVAAGTPDPGTDDEAADCNIGGPPSAVTLTGSRTNCVSNFGAFDMVGNLFEWVEDWIHDNSDSDGGSTSSAVVAK